MSYKVPIGRVARPHGKKGEVKFLPYTENFSLIESLAVLYNREKDIFIPFKVEAIRKGPASFLLLKFEGITSLEQAEKLRGKEFWADVEDFPPLEGEEFYVYQLIGCTVCLPDGSLLGKVQGIMPVGPYDLLEIKSPQGKSFYLPMIEDFILKIDIKKGIIWAYPPEGLLDL